MSDARIIAIDDDSVDSVGDEDSQLARAMNLSAAEFDSGDAQDLRVQELLLSTLREQHQLPAVVDGEGTIAAEQAPVDVAANPNQGPAVEAAPRIEPNENPQNENPQVPAGEAQEPNLVLRGNLVHEPAADVGEQQEARAPSNARNRANENRIVEAARSAYDRARDVWRSRSDLLERSEQDAREALIRVQELRVQEETMERRLEQIKRTRRDAEQAHLEMERTRIPQLRHQVQELTNDMNEAQEAMGRAYAQAHERNVRPRLQEEVRSCIVCHERERSVTFRPCSHFVCCMRCGQGQAECPLCHAEIRARHSTIFS